MKKLLQVIAVVFCTFFITNVSAQQWEQMNGPWGGSVSHLVVSGNTIIASAGSGVFFSTNNGNSWVEPDTGSIGSGCRFTALSVCGNTIFAGMMWRSTIGLRLSKDNGISWTGAGNIFLSRNSVTDFAMIGNTIFAGISSAGVYRLAENDTTWTQVNNGLQDKCVVSLAVSGNSIFAGTYNGGVFLSTNNGNSWTAVNNGLTNLKVHKLVVSGNNIFAGTDSGGIFLSSNNGTAWTTVNNGLTSLSVSSFAVSGLMVFAGTGSGGVFLSTNNGASWTAVNNGLPTNKVVTDIAASGDNIFVGTVKNGIFRSTNNGSSWTEVNTGVSSMMFVSLAASSNNIFIGQWSGGVFSSTNGGVSWNTADNELTDISVSSFAVSGDNVFAGTSPNGVFLSTNNGVSWNAVNTGLTDLNIREVLATSGNTILASTTTAGIFQSANNGSSWSAGNGGLQIDKFFDLISANGDTITAVDWDYARAETLFRSTNNCASWTMVTAMPDYNMHVQAVRGNTVFASLTRSGLFLSTDNGTSWINDELPGLTISSFAENGNTIFAGTFERGVFFSTNNGISWAECNNGLKGLQVRVLNVNKNTLYACTEGNSGSNHAFRMDISNITNITDPIVTPIKNTLSINSAHGKMTISYTLPSASITRLNIYTLSGKLITRVMNEMQQSGRHTITLSKKLSSTGMYIVSFKAGNYQESTKIFVTQ